ncbi:MAG TPA: M48 family metallopeptidase [Candidatus Angelobacter sp.]|nr:M48 family metallopeptidase [Candidatus Angelobacter sp.]
MKRWLILLLILGVSGVALYYAQRQKETPVGPQAIVNALAQTEREISRVPAGMVRLSDSEEISAGEAMAQNYVAQRGTLSAADVAIENYVGEVGGVVAGHARRKLIYKFHYIPNANFVNAFALPGGHVFLGKGMLQLMDSEDELASVLGHEVEHVENYHCNERIALEARLRHLPLGGLVTLPIQLFQVGYSKEQEMEADRDGTTLAVMAGYSPQGAIRMFQAFAKLQHTYVTKAQSPDQELSRVAIQGIVGYFRSHPLPEEREAQIRRIMVSRNWPQPQEKKLRVGPEPAKTASTKPVS